MAHRLAPVSHREFGIRGLGAAKSSRGGFVLEIVEQRYAVEEVDLGRGDARIGELDVPVSIGDGRG
jgi:hypothetical protein